MASLDNWMAWHDSIKRQVAQVYRILQVQLSEEPEALVSDLNIAESWNARMQFILADANGHLSKVKFELKPLKIEGPEFDRKIKLEAEIADLTSARDKIEGLVKSLNQRLITASTVLGYRKQFKDHGNMR